jgi:hypothetical protein
MKVKTKQNDDFFFCRTVFIYKCEIIIILLNRILFMLIVSFFYQIKFKPKTKWPNLTYFISKK